MSKIYIYNLIFLSVSGWIQDQAVGSCSTENMDRNKVIQFCSGSNITGNNIVLSTENVSTRITNCTCQFTVTNSTFVNINGNCTTEIFHGFLDSIIVQNVCGDMKQYIPTTRVYQIVYINHDNSTDSYCIRLHTDDGLLQDTCFADIFTPTTTAMFSTTVQTSSSTNEHSSTNRDRTESTTSSTTVKVNSTDINTTTSLTTKNQDDLKLLIIILASVLAIVSTLLIISVVFLVRNRRVKKEDNGPSSVPSNYVSFDRTENIDYETVYTELQ